MSTKAAIGLAALLAAGACPSPVWASVTVRLAPEVVVRDEEISLGDLGTIEGDAALARRLRQVKLGPAPLPGGSQRIDGDYLRLRLSEPQLEPANVRLILPDHVLVTRAFQVLPGAALVEAVSRQARARLEARDPAGGPYAVVPASRPADLRVPTGAVELVARLQGEPSPQGLLAATVTIKVDGRGYQTLPMSLRVGGYRSVLVATRPLEPRSALGPADVKVESRPSTEIPVDALGGLADPGDHEVVRPVRAGEVLTPAMVRQRILVRRGEVVTLLVEGHGFRITTQGLAVADARRGEALRVVNATSKRETLGRVEGAGLVRVPFGEPGDER